MSATEKQRSLTVGVKRTVNANHDNSPILTAAEAVIEDRDNASD